MSALTMMSDADMMFEMQMTMGYRQRFGILLFDGWKTTSVGQFYGFLVAIAVFSSLSEIIRYFLQKVISSSSP